MGILERREVISHSLGSSGRLSVKTLTGTLRVRGIEGEDARVTIDYRIRATDQASAERALDTGRVIVDRGNGSLEIETPERRLATGLAWLFGGARVSADLTIEVPWGARVRLETMSGAIEADTLVGEQKYRTVSGEVRLWNLGGLVEAGTVAGSISLDGGTELRLKASTVSGRIKARASVFHSLNLNTTSGAITIYGALDPSGDFKAESISGSVELTPLSGVTAELRTVSGTISSDVPHLMEGSRGSWRSIVGDGRASLRFNSTSGSIRIRGAVAGESYSGSVPPKGWTSRPAAPAPAAPAAETGAPLAPEPPLAPAPPVPPSPASAYEPTESWNPDESAEDAAAEAGDGVSDEAELEILQALERGEIGVDEAAERLERVRR